jgi:hypothetical protein
MPPSPGGRPKGWTGLGILTLTRSALGLASEAGECLSPEALGSVLPAFRGRFVLIAQVGFKRTPQRKRLLSQ